jgi:hypothetical protein
MGKTRGVIALLAIGGFMVAVQAKAADIGVSAKKYIAIDKEIAAGKSKTVYVAKVPEADKHSNDVNDISVQLSIQYVGTLGNAAASFEVPSGESVNKSPGWLVNKDTVAKFVNKDAPGGPTGAKVVVIKPAKLLKLIGKTRGDSAELDMIANGAPTGSVFTAYSITSGGVTDNFCSEFSGCAFKEIGGGTGRKLVCKGSTPDGGCTAAGPPPTAAVLEFITGPAGGTCGYTAVGGSSGTVLKNLTCGGLNVGGGCFQSGGSCGVNEGPTPDGSATQLNASCSASSCSVSARTSGETGANTNCSDTGCQFGAYLSIANGGTSTCVLNTFSSPASGTLDLTSGAFDGSFPLTSAVTLTGNGADPCPPCVGGFCDGSAANGGATCTALNGAGDSYECVPAGVPLTPFPVDLTPINTAKTFMDTTTDQDQVPGGIAGEFCPGQNGTEPGSYGCFASTKLTGQTCDYIEENGSDAGAMSVGGGTASATLASVFCIPGTGNGLIDGAADLPGPGATSLPGTLELF